MSDIYLVGADWLPRTRTTRISKFSSPCLELGTWDFAQILHVAFWKEEKLFFVSGHYL